MKPIPSRPDVFFDARLDHHVRRVPGVVFFHDELVRVKSGAEIHLFREIQDKGPRSKLDPPLYSSFVRRERVMSHEVIFLDRIRVRLSDTRGWPLPPDVERWMGDNVRMCVETCRMLCVDDLLRELFGEGREVYDKSRYKMIGTDRSPRGPSSRSSR